MEKFNSLFKKLKGKLSDEDEALFRKWLNESEDNEKLFHHFLSLKDQGKDFSFFSELDVDEGWGSVSEKLRKQRKKQKRKIFFLSTLKYAAVFLILLGVGYFYLNSSPELENSTRTNDAITLELDDGTLQKLTPDGEKTIRNKNGTVVTQKRGEQLNYRTDSTSDTNYGQKELAYNLLTVPYGKRFEVVLSDGTRVYLNSGSSLKYPIEFLKGQDRLVYVDGEAYFEVAKDIEHPFIVNAKQVDIRVTGTAFNISCYAEDEDINTVLVEGSVQLSDANGASTPIVPGQLATWHKEDEKTTLTRVDTEIHTGWKEGILLFKHMKFKDIEKKLERHYNVNITNNNPKIANKTYTARFENSSIEHIIRSFHENFEVDYSIENDQITIN